MEQLNDGQSVNTGDLRAALRDYIQKMGAAADLCEERMKRTEDPHSTSIFIHAMQTAGTQRIAATRKYMFLDAGIDDEEVGAFDRAFLDLSDEDREQAFRQD